MRHRSPRRFLDLWRRRPPLRPLPAVAVAVTVSAVFATTAGLALTGQHSDEQPPGAAAPPAAGSGQSSPTAQRTQPSTQLTPEDGRSSTQRPSRSSTPSAPPTDAPAPSAGASSTPSPSGPPADRSAPATRVATVSAGDGTWVVAVTADEPASYECSLDEGGYRPCGPTVSFDGLRPGRHTLLVRATDRAGNTDPSPAEASVRLAPAGSG
jgi:hypothetical protein